MKLAISQRDESSAGECRRKTDSGIAVGWHTYCITSPGDGGATAMNNVIIYIDGVLVASTATNDGTYIAMENTTAKMLIGALIGVDGGAGNIMSGDNAITGIDGSIWTAFTVYRFHQLCKGLYGL